MNKEEIEELLLDNPIIIRTCNYLHDIEATDCLIGGGLLRNIIWNKLLGYKMTHALKDIDIVYYDANTREKYVTSKKICGLPIQFKNQAFIHEWYNWYGEKEFKPYKSLEGAVASWSELCTCIAIGPQSKYKLVIPNGLDDLLNLTVRLNSKSNMSLLSKEIWIDRLNKLSLNTKYDDKLIIIE